MNFNGDIRRCILRRLIKSIQQPKIQSVLIILLFSILLIVPQIYFHAIILGADSIFHFNRFYDTAMQIKTGHFSYFMSLYGFNQSGRIVNALYGPVVAYLNGAVLALVNSWFKYQIITNILLNFVAGFGFYKLSKYAGAKNNVATLMAIVYMNSYWVTAWSDSQKFSAWGAVLIPYVIMQALPMLKRQDAKIHYGALAVIMAIMIQTYMLSALFSVLVLTPFALVGFFTTRHKVAFVRDGCLAVGLTIILTGNIWGGMLDIYGSDNLLKPYPQYDLQAVATSFSWGHDSFGTLGLISSCLFAIQLLLVFKRASFISFTNRVLTYVGATFLLLSSDIMPWNTIGKHLPVLYSFLQFPFRLVILSNVLLLLAVSLTLSSNFGQKISHLTTVMVLIVVLLTTFNLQKKVTISQKWLSDNVLTYRNKIIYKDKNPDVIRAAFKDKNLGKPFTILQKGTPDYLPIQQQGNLWQKNSFKPYRANIKATFLNNIKVNKSVNQQQHLVLSWQGNQVRNVILPVYKYTHSVTTFNHKRISSQGLKANIIGAVEVKQQKGANIFEIGYQPSYIFKMVSILTALAWLLVLARSLQIIMVKEK